MRRDSEQNQTSRSKNTFTDVRVAERGRTSYGVQ